MTFLPFRWSANTKGGELESLGYKEGYRVDVDVAEGTWADAPSFHNVLIFNTGHWYIIVVIYLHIFMYIYYYIEYKYSSGGGPLRSLTL